MKRAVITGMGAITPIGNSVDGFWENLINGVSGAAPITRFDTKYHKSHFACEVKNFDPILFIDKKEVRKLDLFTQYALSAANECMKDSGLELDQSDLRKIGVIIATGIGGISTFEEEVVAFAKNGEIPRFSPYFVTKMISNIAAGQISIRYGLQGINYSLTSACASSNHAIANALDHIRLGRANIILAGGSEASITAAAIGGFNTIKALSTRNNEPQIASRPFDSERDGFVMGEGAGILMIEELEHALNRGARIYCELAGYGAAADAYHVTATHPEGRGAVIAMEDALHDSNTTIEDVDYINAHATSTPVGDIGECSAISKVFKNALSKISISATKSMTGHLLGAAGAVESIACIKSIEQNIIPPTINTKNIDPEIPEQLDIVLHKALEKDVKVVLNNTFGFGGHTASVMFKKYLS